jgi:hypothetical protein
MLLGLPAIIVDADAYAWSTEPRPAIYADARSIVIIMPVLDIALTRAIIVRILVDDHSPWSCSITLPEFVANEPDLLDAGFAYAYKSRFGNVGGHGAVC